MRTWCRVRSGVDLLKQLCKQHDQILISKSDESSKLYVTADNNRMAIKFNRKMPPYDKMLDAIKHDNYVVIDRGMLTSIINLKLTNEDTNLEVDLENEVLKVGNKRFNQSIPLNEHGGSEIGSFKIRVVTAVLEDSIIGDNSMYPDELIISPTKMGNSYMIEFSDESKNWLSVFRVIAK